MPLIFISFFFFRIILEINYVIKNRNLIFFFFFANATKFFCCERKNKENGTLFIPKNSGEKITIIYKKKNYAWG